MLFDPCLEHCESGGLDAAGADTPDFFGPHQIALLKNLKMLTNRCKGDAKWLGQSCDRDWPSTQQIKYGAPSWIGKRVKQAIDLRLRHGCLDFPDKV